MKKLVLKKWVEVVLGIIWIGLIMFIASEALTPVMYLFHLVAIILFVLVSKYANENPIAPYGITYNKSSGDE